MQNRFERPLITFKMSTYNHEKFIAEAVQGAFDQIYSPLEIIISDDCSTDRTFEIVQEMVARYDGPHKIILNRNEKNLGLTGNINRSMELASGEFIVGAAGDDISLPIRVERIFQACENSLEKPYCIFSKKSIKIDENGSVIGIADSGLPDNSKLDYVFFGTNQQWVPGHSNSWHKDVFNVFGPINKKVINEDIVIPFRASLLGSVISIDEPLVKRRINKTSITNKIYTENIHIDKKWLKDRLIFIINNNIAISKSYLQDICLIETSKSSQNNEFSSLKNFIQIKKIFHELRLGYVKGSLSTCEFFHNARDHGVSFFLIIKSIYENLFPKAFYLLSHTKFFILARTIIQKRQLRMSTKINKKKLYHKNDKCI